MKKRYLLLLLLIVLFLIWRMALPVDETQYAIVTRFGEVIGHPIHEPGLHVKMPWDSAIRLDKRLQTYDPAPSEFLLISKKTERAKEGIGQNVIVDWFVNWRILGFFSEMAAKETPGDTRDELLDGPLRFLKKSTDLIRARENLLAIIQSELSASLGRHEMSALVSVNPDEVKISEIEKSVSDACRTVARRDYGIEIEDVRVKRIGLPESNKEAVFQRMRAERQTKATQYRSEGQSQARVIRAEADKEAGKLLSESYKEAEVIKGKGDAEATAVYARAHNKDPEFYRLVRTLSAYSKFLNANTTVVLSGESELLRLLTEGNLPKGKPHTSEKKPDAKNPGTTK